MFSGIVESQTQVLDLINRPGVLEMTLKRPENFTDIKNGDSIAVNGICLTVEKFDDTSMTFALGEETLKVTGWTPDSILKSHMNLERSMRLSDRLHGHLVSGHVDAMGKVVALVKIGEGLKLTIRFAEKLKTMIWNKGSISINGVSLTVNQVEVGTLTVGLIPETLKRTNLGDLQVGDAVTLEVDMMARGIHNWLQHQSIEDAVIASRAGNSGSLQSAKSSEASQ